MDREEARELLLGYSRFINEETDLWEALDLAIEALKGDLHCPKCGTIVRDGRQYHDLVYRGEAEKLQLSGETSTNDYIRRQDVLNLAKDGKIVSNTNYKKVVAHINNIPSANVTDSISRWDLYEKMQWSIDHDMYDKPYDYLVEILEAPSVTPTERTGEWVFHANIPISGGASSAGYICSNCGEDYFKVDRYHYCPNCGCAMTKGGDTE